MRANHDFQLIYRKMKYLALLYYITDYSTKIEQKTHHSLVIAAGFQRAFTKNPTLPPEQLGRLLIVKTYNKFATDRELSGVEIANVLLDQNEYYSSRQFVNINLDALEAEMKFYFQNLSQVDEDRRYIAIDLELSQTIGNDLNDLLISICTTFGPLLLEVVEPKKFVSIRMIGLFHSFLARPSIIMRVLRKGKSGEPVFYWVSSFPGMKSKTLFRVNLN